MKKLLWAFVIIGSIVVIGLIVMFGFKSKIDYSNIKHMRFSYSVGYMMYSNVYYEVNEKDRKYYATIKPNGVANENEFEKEIDKNTLNKIIAVLEKYEVYKWNGFHKSDKNVLDGDSFSFYLRTAEDKDIEASGYMMYPKNYGYVQGAFDEIFMDIYNTYGIKVVE